MYVFIFLISNVIWDVLYEILIFLKGRVYKCGKIPKIK